MNRILISCILLCCAFSSGAQQLSASGFYELTPVLHNPAAAGSGGATFIGGSYRMQWRSMPGYPQTGLLFGSTYLPQYKVGIGGYLYNDVTGPIRRTGLQLSYAYHIPVGGEGSFSIGLEGRGQQYAIDQEKLRESLGNDPVLNSNGTQFKADAGLGLAYTRPQFQVGASVSQLVQSKLNLYEGSGSPDSEARLYRHYYLHGHYHWDVDDQTRVTPSALLIWLPNAPATFQGGVRVEHSQLLWYGLGMRYRQGLMLSAGVHVTSRFSLGYSFELYNSPLTVYKDGSSGQELLLRYDFTKE